LVRSDKGGVTTVSIFRPSSGRGGQSFVEYALLLILVSIVLLSILLILGNDLRTFINDLLQRWFPAAAEALRATLYS
jgi:Flp pilus assembly pilin Flp